MKNSFISYYRPDKEQLSKLWTNCIFIFDANVLLNMYRYSSLTRQDLNKIFSKISDRIWLPHQVALEYQENRLDVIAEQVRKFSDVKKILAETIKYLKAELDKLQLRKRHSSIDPDKLIKKIEPIFKEYENELEKLEKEQPDVFDNDKIRDKFDSFFSGNIGVRPSSQEMLDEIYKEGKTRYEYLRPPGYMDTDKGENVYHCNGLVIKRKFGDLILWNQIINEAKEKKYKYIIFITDDDKEDWWWKVESKGKKIIGPRQELVDEIMSKTDVISFYMYNSERFIEYAQEFFKVSINSESIKQVRNIAKNKATTVSLADFLKNAGSNTLLDKTVLSNSDYIRNFFDNSTFKKLSQSGLNADAINKLQSLYAKSVFEKLSQSGLNADAIKSLQNSYDTSKYYQNYTNASGLDTDSLEESSDTENNSDNNEVDPQ
jgi:hypothetical protein